MKTDAPSNRADRGLEPAVKYELIDDELQRAIDLGVIDLEEETEQRFFASQHAASN